MKSQTDFGVSDAIETPYINAAAAWDTRIGAARVQAKNWRYVAVLSVLLNLMLALGIMYAITHIEVRPYVIEVETSGKVITHGEITQTAYTPSDAVVTYQLQQWLEWVRHVPNDPVVLRSNWERAYKYVSIRGANILTAYARQTAPFAKIGKMTVTIEIASILPVSDDTFGIEWVEVIYDRLGNASPPVTYAGVFTVLIRQPTDESLHDNPLGLYIDSFYWTPKRT